MSDVDVLNLVPMTDLSFEKFTLVSLDYYSKDRAKAEGCSLVQAQQAAKKLFNQTVGQGRLTTNQFFFDVVRASSGEHVGYLWLGLASAEDGTAARINDIFIAESMRSRGYGRKVMGLAETEAKKLGAKKILLHAFRHNERALRLYESLGFQTVSLLMSKETE